MALIHRTLQFNYVSRALCLTPVMEAVDRFMQDYIFIAPAPPPPRVFNLHPVGLEYLLMMADRMGTLAAELRELRELRATVVLTFRNQYPGAGPPERNPYVDWRETPVPCERVRGPWASAKQRLPPPRRHARHISRARTNAQQRQIYGARKWRM